MILTARCRLEMLEVGWGQHLARQTDNGVRALAAGFLGCKATMMVLSSLTRRGLFSFFIYIFQRYDPEEKCECSLLAVEGVSALFFAPYPSLSYGHTVPYCHYCSPFDNPLGLGPLVRGKCLCTALVGVERVLPSKTPAGPKCWDPQSIPRQHNEAST
jgi:hypothetical protein